MYCEIINRRILSIATKSCEPLTWYHHELYTQHPLLVILLNLTQLSLLVLLERVLRHTVQAQNRLVGVLNEDVLALVHTQDHVDDCAHDTPSVVEVERHLCGELAGLVGEYAEDDVIVVVFGVGTGNETVSY